MSCEYIEIVFEKEIFLTKNVESIVLKYSVPKEWVPRKIRETIKPLIDIDSFVFIMSHDLNDNFVVDLIIYKLVFDNEYISRKRKEEFLKKIIGENEIDIEEYFEMNQYKDGKSKEDRIANYLSNSNERLTKYILSKYKNIQERYLYEYLEYNKSECAGKFLINSKKAGLRMKSVDNLNEYKEYKNKYKNNKKDKQIIETIFKRPKNEVAYFSGIDNDTLVNYLIKTQQIYYYSFLRNDNKISKKWLFENKKEMLDFQYKNNMSNLGIDYIMDLIKTTPKIDEELLLEYEEIDNEDLVDLLIKNPKFICPSFSENPNDKAVKYLIDHEELIDLRYAVVNINQNMIDWLIKSKKRDELSKYHMFSNVRLIEKLFEKGEKFNVEYKKMSTDPYMYEDDMDKFYKIVKSLRIPN